MASQMKHPRIETLVGTKGRLFIGQFATRVESHASTPPPARALGEGEGARPVSLDGDAADVCQNISKGDARGDSGVLLLRDRPPLAHGLAWDTH